MVDTQKKSRLRHIRELELIEIAREIIESEGLAALTMDKVTANCAYSKGTVYNHFSCKEDLLVAVSNEGLKDLQAIFAKLEGYKGNGREQMIGLQLAYLYFSKLYPSQFLCVLSVKNPAILNRTSEERKKEQLSLEIALESIALKIVEQAQKDGELSLKPEQNSKQVTFANWSQSFGALVLVNAAESLVGLQGIDVGKEFFINAFTLNDGFNWAPLSNEYDYFKAIETLKSDVFQKEEALVSELKNQGKETAALAGQVIG